MSNRPKIAAIITTYYPRSHADVIVGKFIQGFPTDEGLIAPQVDIVSIYMDQVHENDIGLDLAKQHDIPVYQSIPQALTLGGKELAVDGVLIVGEHGDYAFNERGQHLYPRRYFFEQVSGVIAKAGRPVPVFTDKHLSYEWTQGQWMYERAKQLDIPFMAGSSIPLFWRDPWLEHELETPIETAVAMSYGGLEAYGFHGLEGLQCMVERRRGGESGIRAVRCLKGEAAWEAGGQGDWSLELAAAALERVSKKDGVEGSLDDLKAESAVFMLEYNDGLRAALVQADGYGGWIQGWSYAAQVAGKTLACGFGSHAEPFPHFSYLSLNAQEMFLTGKAQYPVERTLLITGALDALMDSHHTEGKRIETPHLNVCYQSYTQEPIRPKAAAPSGASVVPF
jgi:hypothetical protein